MTIRPLLAADVDAVAEVDFAAFQDVALRHGTTPRATAVRESRAAARHLLDADPFGGFVAEDDGRVVGHGWLHARGPIATLGPIAVEPPSQGRGVGRALLAHCLQAAGSRAMQVRLVQESFDLRTLHLCLSAGFRIVAPLLELVLERGTPAPVLAPPSQVTLRAAEPGDHQRIVARDARTFGTPRPPDVDRRLRAGSGVVVERGKALAGYAVGAFGVLGSAAADDPELVLVMLATLAAEPALRTAAMRATVLATDRVLVDGLRALGFRPERACHYMIRGGGTAPPTGYVLMGRDYM